MYNIETLVKTFRVHHERSQQLNKKLIAEFKENNPGEEIPDPFNDDFSLPLALEAICKELLQLKCDHDWHEEEMRGLNSSKWFCSKCNLEKRS